MDKDLVVIVTDGRAGRLYRSLRLRGAKQEICSLRDAAECVYNCGVDLVILDCGFDVGRGLSLLKQLKTCDAGVPVVFLTDCGSEDSAVKAYDLGARQYFKKPVHLAELADTVEKLLRIKKEYHEERTPLIFEQKEDPKGRSDMVTTACPPNLVAVLNYIEDNLSRKVILSELARLAGLSKYHFCRMFKQQAGVAPLHFVNGQRIKRACELLAGTGLTVSRIASEVGYSDCASLNRQFKHFTGMTPTAYRHSPGNLAEK
ncbi:MAG: helix-turn-helix domain-containing protein [Nitrospirota bacterium]